MLPAAAMTTPIYLDHHATTPVELIVGPAAESRERTGVTAINLPAAG